MYVPEEQFQNMSSKPYAWSIFVCQDDCFLMILFQLFCMFLFHSYLSELLLFRLRVEQKNPCV